MAVNSWTLICTADWPNLRVHRLHNDVAPTKRVALAIMGVCVVIIEIQWRLIPMKVQIFLSKVCSLKFAVAAF